MNEKTPEIQICHFSDLHLPIDSRFPFYKLASKRALGYMNLRLNRSQKHQHHIATRLLAHLVQRTPRLTICTGDLTNLALDEEYEGITALLKNTGFSKSNLMIIPGNHDRYTPGAQWCERFEKHVAHFNDTSHFPLVKIVENVVIIGIDTATWRGPFRSAGSVSRKTIAAVQTILDGCAPHCVPLIAMHHPPFKLRQHLLAHYLGGLQGYQALLDMLAGRNATVIHGHLHRQTVERHRDTLIVGVPSISMSIRRPDITGSYHTLNFDHHGLTSVTSTAVGAPPTDEITTTYVPVRTKEI